MILAIPIFFWYLCYIANEVLDSGHYRDRDAENESGIYDLPQTRCSTVVILAIAMPKTKGYERRGGGPNDAGKRGAAEPSVEAICWRQCPQEDRAQRHSKGGARRYLCLVLLLQ